MLIRQGVGSARSGTANASISLPWTTRTGLTVVFDIKPNQSTPFNVWDIDNGSTGWLQLFANAGALDIWCDNSPSQIYTAANALVSGMWTRVCVSPNGASTLIAWKKATDSTITFATANDIGTNPITNMWLASDGFGGENGDGSYKHFKLWKRNLSRKEIAAEFVQGAPVSLRGLHTYLPMRNGQSDTSPHAINRRGIITAPWTRTNTWLSDRSQPSYPDLLHP